MHKNDHQAVTSKEGVGMTARTESRVSLPMLPISRPTWTGQNCQMIQQWANKHAKIQGCHGLAWGTPRRLLCSSKPLQMLWSTLIFRIDATGTRRCLPRW